MAEEAGPPGRPGDDSNAPSDSEEPDQPQHLCLDLGDDLSHKLEGLRPPGEHRRERDDNPFSFKHFLRSDTAGPYQNKGARPKVYCETRSSSLGGQEQHEPPQRIAPEFSSALPDFVQDHLVIEQCYLGGNSESPIRPHGFPLDLPRNVPNEGSSKSLPDFLADSGAVCTSDTLTGENSDTERLRHEIDGLRRHLAEQTRRADCLQMELDVARNKEHDYTQNLAKALEQVEDNLEKSKRRASSAEATILKLKNEMGTLKAQINQLKYENKTLRGEEAASGGGSNEIYSRRLAQELRAAAGSAELSLRQLLTGVDNLRTMAASLDNIHRIEEEKPEFHDTDKDSGPAL